MASIEIDGTTYEVTTGDDLLKVCLSLGLDLPYFCWHPCMGSVGACRQCAVIQYHDQDDQQGRLVMSCMTPVTDGMRVSVETPEAKEFRAEILELLMTNHPHDCPVCEEGGECHLQDMTVMTGHTSRLYRGTKRTHTNQYLGPFINHEMNRCIACYRCVRYYRDYAGGDDLQVLSSAHNVYFGRHEDGVLENEFSGNLVEVCPTGVFTDKTLNQRYARKWDLQAAPSVCTHCSVGCNISPGERYGELRRVVNRYHGDINRYFLCDRGRFGYGFVNGAQRIRKALIEKQEAISKQAAQQHLASLLENKEKVIGIGSPRASLESNFALRELVGADKFHPGFDETEQVLISSVIELIQNGSAHTPSLSEVEQADAVFVLGEDVTNTAPRLALSLRQAVRNRSFDIAKNLGIPSWHDDAVREAAQDEKSPLFIAGATETRLDDVATEVYFGSPDDIARLGFAVAHRLDSDAPAVKGLSSEENKLAGLIANSLQTAKRPLVVSGTGCQNKAVIDAAANITKALSSSNKALSLVVPECNSIGLGLMGGSSLQQAAKELEFGAIDTVIILENNLYRRASREFVDQFLDAAKHVVVIDHSAHETADKAELVLPAATFAETDGTLVNNEGRAQRFFSVLMPDDEIMGSWKWLMEAADGSDWSHLDDITDACANALPIFKPILDAAPESNFRITGMKIPRQPHRYSGRTAMLANINVSEPKQPVDTESALSFSMEGLADNKPSTLNPGVWAPSWNSNQSVNKFQDEIGGHLTGGDPGIRLLESKSSQIDWFNHIPKAYKKSKQKWLLVPLYHIFGSEELSVLSESLAGRVPDPYLAINPDDALNLKLQSGDSVEIELSGDKVQVPVLLQAGLRSGVAGMPAGISRAIFPSLTSIRKVKG